MQIADTKTVIFFLSFFLYFFLSFFISLFLYFFISLFLYFFISLFLSFFLSFFLYLCVNSDLCVNIDPYVENCNSTPSIPPITLFVRMAGKLKEHRTRFYCDLFRTAVLFWPASFGKTVEVLDEESEQDHIFANVRRQSVPDRKLEVAYELLPKDASILSVGAATEKDLAPYVFRLK